MAVDCANPLLLEWIKEWLDEARERNSKGMSVYKKAYDSMKACPISFNHPSEAQQLNGLGPKLCDRLTENLRTHCAENGLPMPEPARKARKRPSNSNLPDDPLNTAPTKKPRKLKPYVPSFRSGGYAIILALLTLAEDSSEGLTKAQLIELAQPHCDSSFAAPSDPGKCYTAWNSHKTLLEKNLIYTWGRPLKKYTLTDEGREVAKRIQNTTDGSLNTSGNSNDQDSTRVTQITRQENALRGMYGAGHIVDLENDESHQYTTQRSQTRVEKVSAREHGGLAAISTEQLRAELESRQAAESHPRQRPPSPDPEFIELLSSPHTSQYKDDEPPTTTKENLRPKVRTTSKSTEDLGQDDQPNQLPSVQPLLIAPGTFTIELVLDNREVRSKTDRDYIEDELARRGIQVIKRSLELGDALWVAKCKDPLLLPRLGEEGDEIVLDYIVERKRLDDLVASIKDRRFHEQKFRLRRSGVRNVIYIIEEIALGQETAQKYHEMIQSAIASTQVLDGYFVKKTQKLDDTIRYLTRMTVMLKALYKSTPLNLLPSTHLSPTTYLPLLSHLRATQPGTPHYITFPSFSSLASKSNSLTLRDTFLKMLMCTRGVTGEKAMEIQKRWRTPREFVEALEGGGRGGETGGRGGETGGREGREMLFREMGALVGKKKIGKAISVKVVEVWGGE